MDTDTAATVIIGQKVRAGSEQPFEDWQKDLNSEAVEVPGFPRRRDQSANRGAAGLGSGLPFRLRASCQAWINSATRQERLAVGQMFFDGPGTQQVLGGGARQADPLVTVVVTHRVRPEDEDEFLAWQERLRLAESKFPGFRGTELFRPVDGVQDEWTTLYRYDTAADLDRWLVSDERRQLLAEGEKFADFQSRTIDNSFGSWFAFDEHGHEAAATVRHQDLDRGVGRPLPDGRVPVPGVVAVEDAAVAEPARRKPVLQLRHDLPDDAVLRQPASEALATTTPECACGQEQLAGHRHRRRGPAFWTVVFYLVTRVFWHLP